MILYCIFVIFKKHFFKLITLKFEALRFLVFFNRIIRDTLDILTLEQKDNEW